MDIALLIAQFLTPILLLSGLIIWGKKHVNYVEKESSLFLNTIHRLTLEHEFLKNNVDVFGEKALEVKEREIEKFMPIMNASAIYSFVDLKRLVIKKLPKRSLRKFS